jgi:hypothetical protein
MPPQIKDATAADHIFWLAYGDPGIEKTRRLVGTCADLGPTLVLRPPTGHIDAMRPEDKSRVKTWKMSDWDDMDQAEDYLRSAEGAKWEWVVVEDLSLLQDHLLDDELETEINQISRNPKRALFGPDEGVYGRNFYKLASWFRHVIGPDQFNLLVICHVSSVPLPSPDKDAEGDPVQKLMPWIQGKNMSTKICGYMKMVTLMSENDKGRRFLRTASNQYFYAKDAFHIAPEGVVWDPTTPKVVDLINKSRGAAKSAKPKSTTKAAPARRRVIARKGGR